MNDTGSGLVWLSRRFVCMCVSDTSVPSTLCSLMAFVVSAERESVFSDGVGFNADGSDTFTERSRSLIGVAVLESFI